MSKTGHQDEKQQDGGNTETEEMKTKLNRMRQLLQGAHVQLKENAKKVTQSQQETVKYKEENLVMQQEIEKIRSAHVCTQNFNNTNHQTLHHQHQHQHTANVNINIININP